MLRAIQHHSFYRTGTWIDELSGVYVGWTAHRDSFCDGMPICNETGNAILVFSGEEYPEPAIVCHLRQRGHQLQANGPSYLVHLYEEDHDDFPARLNGGFHGLVIDRTRGTTTLFNDRYGMHRLCYYESKEAFYFAVES